MTKELIGKLRELSDRVFHGDTKPGDFRIIDRAADTLAARQPTEDDREAIAKALCEGADTCWNDLTEQELVWHYRDAESVLAAGFSRAAVPDAATEAAVAEGDQCIDQAMKRVEALEAERDAALAAIERCRGVLSAWESRQERNREILGSGALGHFQAIDCTGDLRAALDGAPEPEWEGAK